MQTIKLNALVFEDANGGWIAQCVEYDIAVHAGTLLHLPKVLERQVLANVHVNRKLGRDGLAGIPPAPAAYRAAFEAAKDRFIPEARPDKKPIEIDEFRVGPKRFSSSYPVDDIIEAFVARGCKHNIAEETVTDSDGDAFGVSYLLNPVTGGSQPLVDLDRKQSISEWELAFWERRLGIKLPRPPK
jgi:hypothetical protein